MGRDRCSGDPELGTHSHAAECRVCTKELRIRTKETPLLLGAQKMVNIDAVRSASN